MMPITSERMGKGKKKNKECKIHEKIPQSSMLKPHNPKDHRVLTNI